MHKNLCYEHGKPHTGWSSCESRRSISCTKIHDANTESPYLGIPASRVIIANTESQNTWCNMATSEERLRNRREHDRLRRQMETTEEREATIARTKRER